MIYKNIDDITEEDLQFLVQNEILEKRNLEYKAELALNTDKEKIEFLADISSLANTSGGDLFIGIAEDREKGTPKEITGIAISNRDQEKQRIENLIRDTISPRMIAQITFVKLKNENYVIVLRIPSSWASPHRVVLKGHDKFYARNSAGKYPLDVDELRGAFGLSTTLRKNLLSFQKERVFAIQANEAPLPLGAYPKTILHLIPMNSLSRPTILDIKTIITSHANLNKMNPIDHGTEEFRYNFEGFLTWMSCRDNEISAYFQLFRNGIIESTEAYSFMGENIIRIDYFEDSIITSLANYLLLLKTLSISTPIFLFLTLVGVKNYSIPRVRGMLPFGSTHKIGKNVLHLPEQIIEDYSEPVASLLRPVFDALWNAGGYPSDPYYDPDNTWKKR